MAMTDAESLREIEASPGPKPAQGDRSGKPTDAEMLAEALGGAAHGTGVLLRQTLRRLAAPGSRQVDDPVRPEAERG
jgi:hypothetical protein